MSNPAPINIPSPELQIDFSVSLAQIRGLYLQEALSETVRQMAISQIDRELAEMVPEKSLSSLASHGLRGELLFAVPSVLTANPRLLGYYRLLLGFSQKEFYSSRFNVTCFRGMEFKGRINKIAAPLVLDLCRALIASACGLLDGIGAVRISRELLDDLTLLTLGPQLRGGANVIRGARSIQVVFRVIHDIVEPFIVDSGLTHITIENAAKRRVLIEFAPDPDIIIRDEMTKGNYRNIIAIEVKGGTDFSNIHNRIGEAEKSHQKARKLGYTECWTVVNVDRIDVTMARQESPSTNRFYRLSQLESRQGAEFEDFRNRLVAMIGIPGR